MQYAYLTDVGKVRERNEDSVIIVKNKSNEILMCVADGMGGHKNGEVASSIVVSLIGGRFKDISSIGNKDDAINWLQSIVSEANVEIFKYVQANPESTGMGTTLVLAVITKEYILFGNVGDSSGFVMKNKELHKTQNSVDFCEKIKSPHFLFAAFVFFHLFCRVYVR